MNFDLLDKEAVTGLIKNAFVGIITANRQGVIESANQYIEQQFGFSESELKNKSITTLLPNLLIPFSTTPGEEQKPTETNGIKSDGTELPVELNFRFCDVEGETYSIIYINEITHKKEAERVLDKLNTELEQIIFDRSQSLSLIIEKLGEQIKETQRKEAALQRANNYLTNVWNYAGAVIFVYDTSGIIQFVNPAAEKALGYSTEELVSLHTPMIFHVQEELTEKAREFSELLGRVVEPGFDVLVSSTLLGKAHDQEWQYIRKDGSNFFVSLSMTQLKDVHNNVTGYLGIALDITEKKKSEIELLTALRKEKELNELKSRFVSMASHEFRTPLSAVLSSAYLLGRYVKADEQPQRDKHIGNIVSSVTSLTEILNDFLSVGKIEEGNINPHFSEFDVKELIEKIIKEVQHLLKENQTISYHHFGLETTLFLDPSMLKHIIRNLLSNAIKFSTDESIVEVYSERTGNLFLLSVKDYGIGIPENEHGNLFNIFFRSSYATNIQGTGLGLHIVKKYVELMGGSIDFKSAIGQGAEFTIKFNSKSKLI